MTNKTLEEEAMLNRRMYDDDIGCPINTGEIKQALETDDILQKWLKNENPTKVSKERLLVNECFWA